MLCVRSGSVVHLCPLRAQVDLQHGAPVYELTCSVVRQCLLRAQVDLQFIIERRHIVLIDPYLKLVVAD